MKNYLNHLFRHFTFDIRYSLFIITVFLIIQPNNSFAGDYHNQKSRRPSASQSGGVTLACAQCHTMHGSQGGGTDFNLIYSTSASTNIFKKLIRADSVVNLCRFCHQSDIERVGAPIIFDPENFNTVGSTYAASAGAFSPGKVFPATVGASDCNASPAPPTSATITDGDRRHDLGCDVSDTPPPGFIPYAGQPIAYNSTNIQSLSFWKSSVITRHGDGDGILSCEYCHDQHGNTNYRNVRPTPYDPNDRVPPGVGGGSANDFDGKPKAEVTYVNGAAHDGISSVQQIVINGDEAGDDPANQFKTSNMKWMKHDIGGRVIQIAGFCGKCHINFYGVPGDKNLSDNAGTVGDNPTTRNPWRRHPVGGITVGTSMSNGHTDPQYLGASPTVTEANMIRVINSDAARNTSNAMPFCFSCHRVHGSTRHSNLIFGPPTSVGGTGTKMRDTCQQCHNQ